MIRTILRVAGIGLVVLAVVVAVLYQFFGLRFVLDGGGTPHPQFVRTGDGQAERIERHREAQRAAASPVEVAEPAVTATSVVPLSATEPAAVAKPVAAVPTGSAPYWTDFRGPNRDGDYREAPVMADWPAAGLTPLWKQPVGGGYASFVVARGRAFTIEQRGAQEVVAAYDVPTGRELWTNSWAAEFRESMGGDGPRATPTWSDGKVYALGATGELRALDDANGKVIWRTNILSDSDARNLDWGMAAAPLVVDDTVIVLPGGPDGRSIVGYDRATGKRAWSALGDKQAYCSPMLVTLCLLYTSPS